MKIEKLIEKLKKVVISPKQKVMLDDMEDETGLNIQEEAGGAASSGSASGGAIAGGVANGGGFSAQTGTAPTSGFSQVTVNGNPWTAGKSYKAVKPKRKKKKIEKFIDVINYYQRIQEELATDSISVAISNFLDELNFESTYSDKNIVYLKEGKHKHYIEYIPNNEVLNYIIKDETGKTIYKNMWEIDYTSEVGPMFKEIETIFGRYE